MCLQSIYRSVYRSTVLIFFVVSPATLLAQKPLPHNPGNQSVIRFDMPPTTVAQIPESPVSESPVSESPVSESTVSESTDARGQTSLVTCNFQLSSLIASPNAARIDQWLVTFQPRDSEIAIADYAPRTDFSSDVDGPIQVKSIQERTQSMGVSLNGDYGKVLGGSAAADGGTKSTDSEQFNRVAPVQAVTASGSINRGRGVYFKLRWTAKQVLEGEKSFQLTLEVPKHWRGSLFDISVAAQSQSRGFAPWDNQVKTLGAAHFVVAAYPDGDAEAAKQARRIALTEQALRDTAANFTTKRPVQTLPGMIRHIAAKLDLDSPEPNDRWMHRLIRGQADPYMDREIGRLPMEVRVAAIDYHDAKSSFAQLTADAS